MALKLSLVPFTNKIERGILMYQACLTQVRNNGKTWSGLHINFFSLENCILPTEGKGGEGKVGEEVEEGGRHIYHQIQPSGETGNVC